MMRGAYHSALRALIVKARKDNLFVQESMGKAIGRDQKTISNYLAGKRTLDLDEAEAALVHIGSTLREFVNDPANVRPVVDLSVRIRRLMTLDEFASLVDALSALPPESQRKFAGQFAELVPRRRPVRGGGNAFGPVTSNSRTKPREKKHR